MYHTNACTHRTYTTTPMREREKHTDTTPNSSCIFFTHPTKTTRYNCGRMKQLSAPALRVRRHVDYDNWIGIRARAIFFLRITNTHAQGYTQNIYTETQTHPTYIYSLCRDSEQLLRTTPTGMTTKKPPLPPRNDDDMTRRQNDKSRISSIYIEL